MQNAMLFPMVWTMGAAKVTLEADGTCHGEIQGMLDVLETPAR